MQATGDLTYPETKDQLFYSQTMAQPIRLTPTLFITFAFLAIFTPVRAQAANADSCDEMSVWNPLMGMCDVYPMPEMPMRMLMLQGNLFAARVWQSGPRAQNAWAAPNMEMADLGTSWGDHHYFNLDVMATGEKWVFPSHGYPLFLQTGENDSQGQPFVDAQHPHSSPFMGLTLSDTISFGQDTQGKNYLKVFFAPRGEATDGPIAFMHRTTGMVNPDAPLGHHIGQDVGHISSTVLGASLKLGPDRFEVSAYHGAEPEPERVDLPLGSPDSFSLRVAHEFSPTLLGMLSFARAQGPEPDQPDILFENRYSASAYWQVPLSAQWVFYGTSIYGTVTGYDHASALSSFTEEFLFKGPRTRLWGRVEVLQRSFSELTIANTDPYARQWVTAATLGYTHPLAAWDAGSDRGLELGLGGSITRDFLPASFAAAYGGDPWSGKVFLQLSGMRMWDF